MSEGNVKQLLLSQLVAIFEMEKDFWSKLPESEREQDGTFEAWSPKDNFAHVLRSKTRWANRLEGISSGELTDVDPPRGSAEELYEEESGTSWEELEQLNETANATILDHLESLPEEDLEDGQRFEWMNGRPLWSGLAFTAYYHAIDHISSHFYDRGDLPKARELHERMAEDLKKLDAGAEWQGNTIYNLACFYAIRGDAPGAIRGLEQALEMNPQLVEWSKSDSDLDSLRELPEFKALFKQIDLQG